MTTTKDILAYFRKLNACEPGMTWLTNQLEKKPDLSFEQLWKMALVYNPKDPETGKLPLGEGSHLGKSWLAWICRHVAKIPCSTSTFSAMFPLYNGPGVDKISLELAFQAISDRLKEQEEV